MINKVMLGLAAAAVLGVGTPTGKPAQDPTAEIAELKRQVARLQADVGALKQAVASAEQSEEEKQLVAYVEAQAKAAGVLRKVLDESEAKGFTYGINPESREVLLAGLHEFAQVLQDNVPGAKPAASGR
jgi:hypothetical protein